MTTYRQHEDGSVTEIISHSMTTEPVISWKHGEPKRKLTVRDYHSDTYRAAQRQLIAKPEVGTLQHFEVDERCLASYLAAESNQDRNGRVARNTPYGQNHTAQGYLDQYGG